MGRKLLLTFLALTAALMLTFSCMAAGNVSDQMIVLGQNGIYDLNGAVKALKENSGNAVIYLTQSIYLSQPVELPSGLKGLKSVTLASYNGSPVTVSMNSSVICAGGIPFTLDQGVTLSDGFLVGGKCNLQYGTQSTESSVLIVNGSADLVIGGGMAMGYGVVSSVKNVDIVINGKANSVHGGGYAYGGGVADVSGQANIIIPRSGSVKNAVYGGGYAVAAPSNAPVNAAHVVALGSCGKVNQKSGMTDQGGKAAVGAYKIEKIIPKTPTPVPTATPYYQYYPNYQNYQNNPYYYGNPDPNGQVQIWNPTSAPVNYQGQTVMYIGPNQQARNFNDAVNLLPRNAGNVEFRIMENFLQENEVIIPQDRGILSLKITGSSGRMTVSWKDETGFFANGIPTTIENTVYFNGGTVYGGGSVLAGQQSTLQSTYLNIAGKVNKVVAGSKANGSGANARVINSTLIFSGKADGWLYGGGAALYGGYSTVDNVSLTTMQGSNAEQSIAGGGYADQSSSSRVSGQTYLNLRSTGSVGQSVWYGGRAYKNSSVYVDTASAVISGRVGASVHKEGRASDGGITTVRAAR